MVSGAPGWFARWEEWFDLLDEWGAAQRAHPEIARWLSEERGVDGWDAQSVTVGYERASGRRAVGEHADGFAITASKTVAVPLDRLYEVRRRIAPPALAARGRAP